jgi:hypothetical protein
MFAESVDKTAMRLADVPFRSSAGGKERSACGVKHGIVGAIASAIRIVQIKQDTC